MVVVDSVVTTALLAVWFVFCCGFAVQASFGCEAAVDVSLVNMSECCGSVVLVVDAC